MVKRLPWETLPIAHLPGRSSFRSPTSPVTLLPERRVRIVEGFIGASHEPCPQKVLLKGPADQGTAWEVNQNVGTCVGLQQRLPFLGHILTQWANPKSSSPCWCEMKGYERTPQKFGPWVLDHAEARSTRCTGKLTRY